jgi:hypothetical protein
MSKDNKMPPKGFEVRFRVDELMGPIYDHLNALPPKYRHREALQATRAYYEGRARQTHPQAWQVSAAGDVPHYQPAPGRAASKPAHEEGVAAVRELDALVDAIPDAMLEGPPATLR